MNPIWAPQTKKGGCVGQGFYYSQSSFTDLFWIPPLYSSTKRPGTKLLITEWTALMPLDATRDFLILDQNNLMFDLRWKKPESIVTIWCKFQLAFIFFPLSCLVWAPLTCHTECDACRLASSSLYRELACDAYLLQRSYPSIQMAIPCKTSSHPSEWKQLFYWKWGQ